MKFVNQIGRKKKLQKGAKKKDIFKTKLVKSEWFTVFGGVRIWPEKTHRKEIKSLLPLLLLTEVDEATRRECFRFCEHQAERRARFGDFSRASRGSVRIQPA